MADFMIHFFLCNVFISFIIGILLFAKQIFKKSLSSRMQYQLWFVLLALLAVPFLPFRLTGFPQMLSHLRYLNHSAASVVGTGTDKTSIAGTIDRMRDFALSVNSRTSSMAGLLFGIWILGVSVMLIRVIRSALRLHALEKSSLPLQNPKTRRLYSRCLKEMKIKKEIPILSTAFLKSPSIAGLLRPRIYLPICLICDDNETAMRYILLHELQHYKHRDALAGYLMNLAEVIYWFHPLVWYAMKKMRCDKEMACDISVLNILEEDAYIDYGNTLINFAEKASLSPFPFSSGLTGNGEQLRQRILNIASYQKPAFGKKLKGFTAFTLIAVLLLGTAPILSAYAAEESHYQWNTSSENISCLDLSSYFGNFKGCFVLYDRKQASWSIHDMEQASLRVSPDSTYKIYDALFGLEEGIITPEASFLPWNGDNYPFEEWNADQTLTSAMSASVNWYFQTLDRQLGISSVSSYIRKIGYGNENLSSGLSAYWIESSLKISPIEQVKLLARLQNNSFGFSPENIRAVKDAICLSASDSKALYGKTGTGRVNGKDVNGWFVGFVETADNTYFFAANIKADDGASGSAAAGITMSILSDMHIWNRENNNYSSEIRY